MHSSTPYVPFEVPVLPMGNLLPSDVASYRQSRSRGLGLLATLPDVLLVRMLDTLITENEPQSALAALAQFACASSFAYAFAADEDLWRRLAFALYSPSRLAHAPFAISWRATLVRLRAATAPLSATAHKPSPVYSEILFHKSRCRVAPIEPAWLLHQDVPRVSAATISTAQFRKRFEQPRRPVILTDAMAEWPAFHTWTCDSLAVALPHQTFNAGGFSFSLSDYFRYCRAVHDADDQSLYVFDPHFAEKAPALASDFSLPHVFEEDLFDVLGSRRPQFQWLIAGPPRSGSSFHKDPNATSAWNAAIRGRKKWLFFPPTVTPPGITPSADGADVTAPVSIMEWFVNFYNRDMIERAGALECVVQPGEIIFVPRGWWHCVLNLDVSIAITQNFVSSVNVDAVVRWVRNCPEQVSGCRSKEDAAFLSSNFARLVVEQYPHLKDRLNFALSGCSDQEATDTTVSETNKRKAAGLWQSLKTTSTKQKLMDVPSSKATAPFSFGF